MAQNDGVFWECKLLDSVEEGQINSVLMSEGVEDTNRNQHDA